jgi:hypothetical protein
VFPPICTIRFWRITRLARPAALALVFVLCASKGWAQSLEPRAYSNTPVGLNFLIAAYDYGKGEAGFDPSVPITDAHLHTDTELIAYSHSLDAWTRSAKFDLVMPVVSLGGSALIAGQPRTRDISGLGDPQAKFAINLFGAPAMSLKEFQDFRQNFIVGASLKVSAPWGQYDSTKLINIGTNRWSFKPELGVSKALEPWTFDLYAGVTLYTENTDFFNRGTLRQDPIYSAQAHVMRGFPRGIWVSLDATYYWGGRTTVNDLRTATLQANSRFGTTFALPINRYISLKLYAAAGTSTRTHSNFNNAGIAWQYRWGSGI